MRISPLSGRTMPKSTFISVVLPAPFSPRRPWISPSSTVRVTSSFATRPAETLGDVDEFELHRAPPGFTQGTGQVVDPPGSVTSPEL